MSAEARRSGTDPGGDGDRPAHRRHHAVERAAVQAVQPAGLEARDSRHRRLHLSPHGLQARDDRLPGIGHPHRIGRDEREARAARERLPQPHLGMHAVTLGRGVDLPHELLTPGFRRKGRRARGQPITPTGSGGEGEAGKQDADDHRRTHVRTRR